MIRPCPEIAGLKTTQGLFSACLWTGVRVTMVHRSVAVYLTAHSGLVKGCEDVRAE